MELREISERWKKPETGRVDAARVWDAMAPDFYKQNVPSFEHDWLLRLLLAGGMLNNESSVFDLGCGTGRYSIALAGRCAKASGVDVSEKMLERARQRAAELGMANVSFAQADWDKCDIAAEGWEAAFDLSLAWLTPAVCDYAGFEKFCRTSRGWCVLGNHLHRSESV